jgi:hypothetical protein
MHEDWALAGWNVSDVLHLVSRLALELGERLSAPTGVIEWKLA